MEIQQHDGVVVEAVGISAGLRQAQREGEVSREGEGGARVWGAAPMRLPTIYRGGGGWFLALQVHWALAKVGERNPIISFPHRLLSPLFRDLDLIPSGYDLIPSKGGSWCALTRGVGPCPHYPRSCGSPMQVGPTSEPSRTFPVQYRKIPNIFRWPK